MNWIIIHLKRNDRGPKGRGSKMFFIKDYSFPKSLKQRRKRHLTIFGHSLLFLKKPILEMSTIYCLAHFTTSIKGPLYLENWLVAVSIRVVVKGGKKPQLLLANLKRSLTSQQSSNCGQTCDWIWRTKGKKPDFKGHPYFLMANKVPLFLDHHKKRLEMPVWGFKITA